MRFLLFFCCSVSLLSARQACQQLTLQVFPSNNVESQASVVTFPVVALKNQVGQVTLSSDFIFSTGSTPQKLTVEMKEVMPAQVSLNLQVQDPPCGYCYDSVDLSTGSKNLLEGIPPNTMNARISVQYTLSIQAGLEPGEYLYPLYFTLVDY